MCFSEYIIAKSNVVTTICLNEGSRSFVLSQTRILYFVRNAAKKTKITLLVLLIYMVVGAFTYHSKVFCLSIRIYCGNFLSIILLISIILLFKITAIIRLGSKYR
ncbi:hypothetical protein RclHR1_03980025 [Rhizophagus clarus]|uniref:Uncharacterized protein n=1 Tax=Rhizophagus clarus TaxID=94130 RepID=A0A2Z6S8Z8_9GLOM|nr:hypothetical protein RclHR1_03980025 [Rhizophagus clarus]